MDPKIEKIYLSVENLGNEIIDYDDENTDVIIRFEEDDYYIASFFTFKNLETNRRQHIATGEFLGGKYFWAEGMVVIDNCSVDNIQKVIEHLLVEGDFKMVFRKI